MRLSGESADPVEPRREIYEDPGAHRPDGGVEHAASAMVHGAVAQEGSTAPSRRIRLVVPTAEDQPSAAGNQEPQDGSPSQNLDNKGDSAEPESPESATASGGGGDIPIEPGEPVTGEPDPDPDNLWRDFEDTERAVPFLYNLYDTSAGLGDGAEVNDFGDAGPEPMDEIDEVNDAGARAGTPEARFELDTPDVSANLHRVGDTLIFEGRHNEADVRVSFEVEGKQWQGLGAGGEPQAELTGKLYSSVPLEETSSDDDGGQVKLLGSGYGRSSSISSGMVSGGKAPHFEFQNGTELILDGFGYKNTERAVEESALRDVQQLGPERLRQTSYEAGLGHEPRMDAVADIAFALVIDIHSSTPQRPTAVYRDAHVDVVEERSPTSSKISAVDDRTGRWVGVEYRDPVGDAMLKVSIADLTPQQVERARQDGIESGNVINAMRTGVVTYASSDHLGLDAITFRPSIEDAGQYLGIPTSDDYVPEIQIVDGKIRITNGYLSTAFQNDPTLQARTTATIRYDVYPNGDRVISLGEKQIMLPDPIQAIREINPFR